MGVAAGNVVVCSRSLSSVSAHQCAASCLHHLHWNVPPSGHQQVQTATEAEAGGRMTSAPPKLSCRRLYLRGLRLIRRARVGPDQFDAAVPASLRSSAIGAGKSTLAHTPGRSSRMRDRSGWTITTGHAASNWSDHRIIAAETILFHVNRSNLTFINRDASEAEIKAPVRSAHAEGFHRSLPKGSIHYRRSGCHLRWATASWHARALLTNPVLLVLDGR